MKFISLCSGIEAASVAFKPLGWQAIAFSEIEPFPCAVLAHHYPDVPNLGDMTKFMDWPEEIFAEADAIVGGPPCQAFSVAGMRAGLNDDRGNLTITYAQLINHTDAIRKKYGRPAVIALYENVPGLLSDKTNAFGCFLAGLAGEDDPLEPAGGRWTNAGAVFGPQRTVAWRVFDAQYFGVAQRRRRVFVVASARTGFNPLAVLFEFDGVRRDLAPSRNPEQTAAAGTLRSTDGGSDVDHARASHLIASGNAEGSTGLPFLTCSNIGKTVNNQTPLMAFGSVVGALCRDSFTGGMGGRPEGAAAGHVLAFHGSQDPDVSGDVTHPVGRNQGQETCVAFVSEVCPTMRAGGNRTGGDRPMGTDVDTSDSNVAMQVNGAMQVRRLTPVECERLQGFPDDYTAIPWRRKPADQCPDGPRYKALGNSWAVPNVRWIGRRIALQLRQSDAESDDVGPASLIAAGF